MTKKKTTSPVTFISPDMIEQRIFQIRGQKVMLDSDLAELYSVTTSRLNEQVRRNLDRFPDDFAFTLTNQEFTALISQNAISNKGRGGRRKKPRVFTEHGILMLSSVLKSGRAVDVNIQIMRTFVQLRSLLASNVDLARRLDQLEAKYDDQFAIVFEAIRELMAPPTVPPKRQIGFRLGDDEGE